MVSVNRSRDGNEYYKLDIEYFVEDMEKMLTTVNSYTLPSGKHGMESFVSYSYEIRLF